MYVTMCLPLLLVTLNDTWSADVVAVVGGPKRSSAVLNGLALHTGLCFTNEPQGAAGTEKHAQE
jgi:hypothetical protein